MKKQTLNIASLRKGSKDQIDIDPTELREATLVLRTVENPMRRKIIDLIQGSTCSTRDEIANVLNKTKQAVGWQLGRLKKAGLIITDKNGNLFLNEFQLSKVETLQNDLAG